MDGETAMMTAVVDAIRSSLAYTPQQCNIEMDEPPATVGEFYVMVMPGGCRPGPKNKDGTVLDEYIDIDVAVIQRACSTPKDRSRSLLIDTIAGINKRHRQILAAFGHFNYAVMNAANALLDKNTAGNIQGFIEPLQWGGMEPKPRYVGAEFFSAGGDEDRAGMVRIAKYIGARRLQYAALGIT